MQDIVRRDIIRPQTVAVFRFVECDEEFFVASENARIFTA
jgi:hypothetical protein